MIKTFVLLCVLSTIFCITGCGHNAVVYGKGFGASIGFVPDQMKLSVDFRYGDTLTAVFKEKTEIKFKSVSDNSAEAGKEAGKGATGGSTEISIKTENQVTGYTVDKIKAEKGK